MNRRERRRQELLNKKIGPVAIETPKSLHEQTAEWLDTLSPQECIYIDTYAKDFSKCDLVALAGAYDRILTVFLDEHFPGMDYDKFTKELEWLLQSEGTIIKTYKMRGKDYMAKIDKMRNEIVAKYEDLKESGNYKNEKMLLEDVIIKFPQLTPTSIKSVIAEHKRALKKLNAIGVETIEETVIEPVKEEKEVIEHIQKVVAENTTTETVEEVVDNVVKESKSKFKILKEIVKYDIQGDFGVYHIENRILTIDNLGFDNKEGIKEYSSIERDLLLKQIAVLDAREQEMLEVFEEFING